jgi:hypothetical protein
MANERPTKVRKVIPEVPVYFISGHGDQDAGTFTVPDGCYVVVKNEIGKKATAYEFHDDYDGLLKLDMKTIRNPNSNKNDIRNAFGNPPRIYCPGEECPRYRYYLCNVHVYDNYILVDSRVGSGLIDLGDVKSRSSHNTQKMNDTPKKNDTSNSNGMPIDGHFYVVHKDVNYGDKTALIKEVLRWYNNSVYPQKKDIEEYLTNPMKWGDNVTLYDMVKDLSNTPNLEFKETMRITQEQLCKVGPGIFYHNVCRALSARLDFYGRQLQSFRNLNGECPSIRNMFYNPVYRELIKDSIPRRCNERQYQQSNYATKKLHQSALRNCKYLKERLGDIQKKTNNVLQSTSSNDVKNKLIIDINEKMKKEILERALDDAEERCRQYSNNTNLNARGRSRNRSNRHRTRNNRNNRNRSRSPKRR